MSRPDVIALPNRHFSNDFRQLVKNRAAFLCFIGLACGVIINFSLGWSFSVRHVGESIGETGFSQYIEVSRLLIEKQSKYQHIQVYEAAKPYYGRVMVLDGVLQFTEGDAASYNEMMAHMALFHHPNPRRVLVIGGGDGYVVSEVLKHMSVQQVDHVDLDGDVVDICRKYFPQWDNWSDPRVNLHITDGAKFCEESLAHGNVTYDVIIQDSSDPWVGDGSKDPLPSAVLYTREHLDNIYRLLDPQDGMFVFQAEMLQIPSDLEGAAKWRELTLEVGFVRSRYASIMIGSYPTGQIGLMLCEKNSGPSKPRLNLEERFKAIQTEYFHPGLAEASFVLPLWAEKAIYGSSNHAKMNHDTLQTINNITSMVMPCPYCEGTPALFSQSESFRGGADQ